MILLIDNYDSFAYNLYQMTAALVPDVRVFRNDAVSMQEIENMNPDAILLSPGPGRPENAGICMQVIKSFRGKIPILGVCLGHQCICEACGGVIDYAKEMMHGKASAVKVDTESPLFRGLSGEIRAGRYHSLSLKKETLPENLKITAAADDGEVMAVEDRTNLLFGVQFHPESILTPDGETILMNFLKIAKDARQRKGERKMIKEAIVSLSKKQDLSYDTAKAVMNEIMNDEASQIQMSAYLTALSMKGETIEEITGSAAGMREHCLRVMNDQDVLEIVGTGGDRSNSFNISTTAAIIIASGGVPVAKHGNRAASSKSGAADVLEALGVKIQSTPESAARLLNKIGICFLFAQNYHLAMKYVAPVRKELGIRTVFNILGPLTNPAGANMQVMGVYEEALVEPLARVLQKLGVKRAMVVYGEDVLDEISLSAPTRICEETLSGEFKSYEIAPEDYGFTRCRKEDLVGGTPAENAEITRRILSGEKGPKRDAVLMNAGAGLYIGGKADTLADGIAMAAELIDSGKAMKKLEEFITGSVESV